MGEGGGSPGWASCGLIRTILSGRQGPKGYLGCPSASSSSPTRSLLL